MAKKRKKKRHADPLYPVRGVLLEKAHLKLAPAARAYPKVAA